MKKILSRLLSALISSLFLVAPVSVLAAVQITEVMYDVSGTDSGREWVEVTNTGSEAVDITKFKFAEGETNHVLKVVSGGGLLAPGASAIIADNASKFKEDWPAYSGVLFDSTFSLSNTGETLSIKNASSTLQDSVVYTATMGAVGNTGSLQRKGSAFVGALPTPGIYPGEFKPVPAVVKTSTSKTTSATKAASNKSSSSKQAAAVASVPKSTFVDNSQTPKSTIPMALWYVGVGAIIVVGVAGALYARLSLRTYAPKQETPSKDAEFEIVED